MTKQGNAGEKEGQCILKRCGGGFDGGGGGGGGGIWNVIVNF